MTDSYALVGAPIDRSPLPAIYNAAFASVGIDATYRLRPAGASDAATVLEELSRGDFRGINVTAPLKQILARHAHLSKEAARASTINTLWCEGSEVHGAQTEIEGVRVTLRRAGYQGGGEALILGAGSGARSVLLALDELGARIHVAARRADRASRLLETVAKESRGDAVRLADLASLETMFGRLKVVVQATPVGQLGEAHRLPWMLASSDLIVADMICSIQTPFLAESETHDCAAIDGHAILLAHAAASFVLWTGIEPPIDAMENALRG